jgi:hypothetical protein
MFTSVQQAQEYQPRLLVQAERSHAAKVDNRWKSPLTAEEIAVYGLHQGDLETTKPANYNYVRTGVAPSRREAP